MLHILQQALAALAGLLAVAGLGYLLAVLWCARRFGKRELASPGSFTPPVSILKPLKGADPEMYECFRSHCLQEYPQFEIVFGVNDAADSAVPYVERLQREFPQIPIRLIVCSEVLGTNRKVSNLIRMAKEARYEHLLVNDADIRVAPDYLKRVFAPFAEADIRENRADMGHRADQTPMGLVSALYRAVPGRTLSSQIEAAAINTEFPGGILMAINIEHGMHFALGSTLAFTRTALNAIGGFEPLVNFLADDYELGNRISGAGFRTTLADTVVETHLPDYTFAGMFRHQLRWARTIRDRRAAQYLGLTIVYAFPWSLLGVMLSGGAMWAWTLTAMTLAVRLINAWVVSHDIVEGPSAARHLWLVPLRDCIALVIWAASYFGSTIVWRGERFRLKKGQLYRTAQH